MSCMKIASKVEIRLLVKAEPYHRQFMDDAGANQKFLFLFSNKVNAIKFKQNFAQYTHETQLRLSKEIQMFWTEMVLLCLTSAKEGPKS